MSKKNSVKPPYTTRKGIPKIIKDPNGNAMLLCPFCKPSHPLQPNSPAACGTILILTAEQTVIHAKYEKKLICVKCGKGGGDMVMYQNAFIHVHNCSPDVMTMTQPPKFSKRAALVYGLKWGWLKGIIERYTGRALPVDEVKQDGTRTGVVLGYFFHKEIKNGKHSQTDS